MNQLNRLRLHRLLALAAVFAVAVAAAQTAPTTTTSPATKPAWYIVDAGKSYNDPTARVHGPLVDGETIYQADLPARANVEYVPATTQKIGSLSTTDNGVRRQGSPVEGQQPWSIGGDDSHGKWNAIPIEVGQHKYLAQALAGWNAGAVIESNAVTINVATTKPTPDTKPTTQPATQPGVTGTIKIPPPPFPTITKVDTTTLATAVWNGRTSFVGTPGTNYIVPAGWGPYNKQDFDCNLNGAVVTFVGTSGDRLLNYASSSRGLVFRDGFVVLGTPEARLGFARVGGSHQTFRNVVIYGGSDVFNANGDGAQFLTLDHIWQVGPYRGNWFYNGDDLPTCVNEGWMWRNVYVPEPIAQSGGLSHVDRLYNFEDFYCGDSIFDNPQTIAATVGAGMRLHNTKGGWITFERCIIGGYENRIGPLLLHPTDQRVVENLTFRNCLLKNRWHVTNGTSGLMFDQCDFDGGTERPLSATDPGECYVDTNGNHRWDFGEPVTRAWPEIRLVQCNMWTSTPSGVFVGAVQPSSITIEGGRGVNPAKHYDGPLRFAVP